MVSLLFEVADITLHASLLPRLSALIPDSTSVFAALPPLAAEERTLAVGNASQPHLSVPFRAGPRWPSLPSRHWPYNYGR